MKVVCELSGGADSALAAIRAKRLWPDAEIHAFFVDYDQPYMEIEKVKSKGLAVRLGLKWEQVSIWNLFGNSTLDNKVSEYFPLRNVVLTAMACSYAEKIGAEIVVNGSKSLVPVNSDPYSFKDSSALFYAMMNAAVRQAGGNMEIRQLLAENRTSKMSRKEVYQELADNNIPMDDTFSCFHPIREHGLWLTCGMCKNCMEKNAIAKELVHESLS